MSERLYKVGEEVGECIIGIQSPDEHLERGGCGGGLAGISRLAGLYADLHPSPALQPRFPKNDAGIVSHDIEFFGFDGEYPALQIT